MKKQALTIVLLLACAMGAMACTSAIIAGYKTLNGRPMLWKHRDTGCLDNRVERIKAHDNCYEFVAIFDATDPLDTAAWTGFNEKGFAIADLMAGDNVETHQRTGKPALTTSTAIRYLLNNAANVEEALELLKGIDMHSDIGSAHHYAMSDATGRSVVVEYVENKMVVTETKAVTNHYLCDAKHNVGLIEGDKRYEQLCQRYEQSNGMMSEKEITKAIESVSQAGNNEGFMGTLWTMVMNLDDHSVTYYSRRHFDKPFHFEMTRKK